MEMSKKAKKLFFKSKKKVKYGSRRISNSRENAATFDDSTNTVTSSMSFFSFDSVPQENNQTLCGQKMQMQGKYPDLLELSQQSENLINNNLFCTVPRKWSYRTRKTRQVGSESQSPLLPGSSADSCARNFLSANSRRPSVDSGGSSVNTSLPTSPGNLNQSAVLVNGLDGSPDFFGKTPKAVRYKTWKLEKFLKENRTMNDPLSKMRENVNEEDNHKYRETSVEAFYSVNKKYLNDTNNFETPFCNGRVVTGEDNNNPRLKNKSKTETKEEMLLGEETAAFWSSSRTSRECEAPPKRWDDKPQEEEEEKEKK
ncbi:hypothetical protein RUM44_011945 [Polyplax serrata]|uniref:Uncharacterized protein n=1 Tax=Polyplax serrata TaxID=468196 RepID=A0ABR1BDT8_POLSC